MKTIHLLVGFIGYESDDIIAAYESKDDADQEAQRLNDLKALRPEDLEDIEGETDEEFYERMEELNVKEKEWRSKFPKGVSPHYDCFEVREITFYPSGAKTSCT